MKILENYQLLKLNTFQIDASAKYFVEVSTQEEIETAIDFAKAKREKILILGGGSNILFTKDFDGLIIKPINSGISVVDEDDINCIIEINSGQKWDCVVSYATENELYGIENLAGIPGDTGAAPIQNIGAYGVEIKDALESLCGFDYKENKWKRLFNHDCQFGYRNSIFKHELKNSFFIYSIRLRLSKENKINLEYSNIKDYFKENLEKISSKKIADVIRSIRSSKLPSPQILGNAGSFFKNPIVTIEKYNLIKKDFNSMPSFIVNNEYCKIPAGWLIEMAGFKGKKFGNVGCYEKQSLIIVNFGKATGLEVLEFSQKIKSEVKNKFDIELEYEVNIE